MNSLKITTPVRRLLAGAAILAGALVGILAIPAMSSSGATVTQGGFHAFADGAGQDISGHAQMVRTADGKTIVQIHVEGLAPATTYASHVHASACADKDADGHYRFDPSGPAMPPNEIRPGPFTTTKAGVGNGYTKAEDTADPTAVSVVVHDPTGAKIACADLV
jgi:hypothetical protein